MGLFNTSKYIPQRVPDLAPIAQDVMRHFSGCGYETTGQPMASGGWHVSLHKGGTFKAVLGMKTALNIEIIPSGSGTLAKASIGIFGQQLVPTMIGLFVFWPVWVTQIAGLVRQHKLDDEAIDCIERMLTAHEATARPVNPEQPTAPTAVPAKKFCTCCGMKLEEVGQFCPSCGTQAV